jgi:hypothetical protein
MLIELDNTPERSEAKAWAIVLADEAGVLTVVFGPNPLWYWPDALATRELS